MSLISNIILFFASPALANVQQNIQHFKPVVVKASRISSFSPLFKYDSATITQRDMEHQQQTQVLESLQAIPGVTIVQSGPLGNQTTIFTRGTNGNHTQVRIDGMRANDPGNANGSYNFANLTTDGLEEINIIRGANSSLYGSNALGGVIVTTTKAGSGTPSAQIEGEFGSYRTFREKLDFQGDIAGIKMAISTSQLDTNGIKIVPKKFRAGKFRHNRDPYHRTSLNSRIDLTGPSNLTLTFFNRIFHSQNHYRTMSAPSKGLNTFQLHRAVLNHDITSDFWSHELGVGFLRSSQHDSIKMRKSFHTEGKRLQLDSQHILNIHSCYILKLIAEWEREEFTFRGRKQHNDGHSSIFALRQFHEIKPIQNWIIELGLSKDWHSKFHSPLNYRLGSNYLLAPTETKLVGSIGTGFKAPSLFELFGDSPFFRANPHLKAEKNFAWDVGIEQKLWSPLQWNISYFHNSLKNLIEANKTFTQLINHARAKTYGIESTLLWTMTPNLQGIVGYTWTRTKNEKNRHSLLRRPKHKWSFTLLYNNTDNLKAGLSAIYSTRSPDIHPIHFTKSHRPPFFTLRLFGDYVLTPKMKIHGRIENALNRHYQDPLGYKKPGFAIYAGLKFLCS
ncbi:MAG TPA: TonB-dependent receptor [Candidatus Nitrosotenuis sp.]|nr:TonB-dependent receptor [Candidatus Nitrosotenuis sp.]